MFSQEFMRNALLAGTFAALACGVSGWFVVLRGSGEGKTEYHIVAAGRLLVGFDLQNIIANHQKPARNSKHIRMTNR